MEIKKVLISSLKESEYNPRILTEKQYNDIKMSLTEFGLVQPIVVNQFKGRKNVIVGGHQRMRVWRDLNKKYIDCVFIQVPLEREKELNVRLNKNMGEFSQEGLANLFDVEELKKWGFEDWEFGDIEKAMADQGNDMKFEQQKEKKIMECPNCGHRF